MATKFLPTVPPFVPGEGLSKLLRHVQLTVKSDNVNYNSDTTVTVFEVPGNILITGLKVNVKTAYDASGTSAAATATIEVPGSTGAIVAWNAGNTRLQAVGTEGMSPDSLAGPVLVPSSGGIVSVKTEPGTTTAGQLEVYLQYIPDVTIL